MTETGVAPSDFDCTSRTGFGAPRTRPSQRKKGYGAPRPPGRMVILQGVSIEGGGNYRGVGAQRRSVLTVSG